MVVLLRYTQRELDGRAEEPEMNGGANRVASWAQVATGGFDVAAHGFGIGGPSFFLDRLTHAVARANRNGHPIAVLALEVCVSEDLDPVEWADCAQGVVGRLRATVRSADTLASLDDTRFGIILETTGSRGEALAAAARLMVAFEVPIAVAGSKRPVDVNVGVAIGANGEPALLLLECADDALRVARYYGPNRFEIVEPVRANGAPSEERDTQTAAEIRSILEGQRELRIVVQPILDLRTGLVAGYEALARFPEGSRPPDQWFLAAHRIGLGAQLEALAIRDAIARCDRPTGTYLSVNVSPSALLSDEVWAVLPERLDGLVFEITEHELIARHDEIAAAIRMLRSRGARIAVDDAGSGYAGLQQLMRLHPELIKLDRALIEGIHQDRVKGALANAIARFAESIGASVCGEGIECRDELDEIAELGFTYAQGYWIGRPGDAWPEARPEASDACRVSVEVALRVTHDFETQATDRRMAAIASSAAAIRTNDDAISTLDLISREMNAEHVCLSAIIDEGRAVQTLLANESFDGGRIFPLESHPLTARVLRTGQMIQVRVSDPIADAAELAWMVPDGYRGLLMAPVGVPPNPTALLEICCRAERPWNRAEIYRARVICQILAPAMVWLLPASSATARDRARFGDRGGDRLSPQVPQNV